MNIVRWDPFGELDTIHDELNRLFGRTFGAVEPSRQPVRGGWMPALDVFETDDRYVAKMDLPGIEPDDVEVAIDDATLTVSGHREFERETDEQGYHRVERRYGSFTRSIALPQTVDAEKVEASFDRGVLTITIAKTAKAKTRRVEIRDVA
ncbi:MAG: Hsp20/alpha crystallin family protein [Actinomycetota bacterium]